MPMFNKDQFVQIKCEQKKKLFGAECGTMNSVYGTSKFCIAPVRE